MPVCSGKIFTLMKKICSGVFAFAILYLLSCIFNNVNGQIQKTSASVPVAQVLDYWISRMEHELVPAAAAMPEDKYSFAPTNGEFEGVRTFAQQVKHFSATQYLLAAGILEKLPADSEINESAPDSVSTKAQIINYLQGSFVSLHKAVLTINEKNMTEPVRSPFLKDNGTRLGLVMETLAHTYNHYGQMVEYLRMNNIIPPASKK